MKLTIVVPDNVVLIDGEARRFDVSGVHADLLALIPSVFKKVGAPIIHAVQWDSDIGAGEIELAKPRANIPITDFAPLRKYNDMWTANAPPVSPPQPDLTDAQRADEAFANNPFARGLVRTMAARLGVSEDAIKTDIRTNAGP